MPAPVFTKKGSQYYDAAWENNRAWARPAVTIPAFQTHLSLGEEDDFRTWLIAENVHDPNFDPDDDIVGYDMRGYWKEIVEAGKPAGSPGSNKTYDTPYSTTFSDKSKYAMPGTPYVWENDKLIDNRTDKVIFQASYEKTPSKTDPGSVPAGEFLDESKLDPAAFKKGLMGHDLDIHAIALYVSGKLKLKLIDQIMDMTISRTIEGASTLTIELNDDDRGILRSGLLTQELDFELDGLWWRMVSVAKDDLNTLTLTFETREIAILRKYDDFIHMARNSSKSRAQFILRMIREVTELVIPVYIPSLRIFQKDNLKTPENTDGIPPNLPAADDPVDTLLDPRRSLMVKTAVALPYQLTNVNTILDVGVTKTNKRKILVCSIMTAIQESSITNLSPQASDPGSAGVYQQRPDSGWGTFEQIQNVVYAATKFFQSAVEYDKANPHISYNDLCQGVQHSGHPTLYGQWQTQAENFVTAFLLSKPPGTLPLTSTTAALQPTVPDSVGAPIPPADDDLDGYYYRGTPSTNDKWIHEDSWTCIGRLADDVNWRRFFKGGTFWYVTDKYLFERDPIMNITESSKGIDSISLDYDRGKKLGMVTIKARIGRWFAEPGDVVVIQNMGPINGKWLVTEFERSLFDLDATIVVKKPAPELPEKKVTADTTTPTDTPIPGAIPGSGAVVVTAIPDYANPFRDAINLYNARIDMGVDYAADDNSPIYAIGPAVITEITSSWLGTDKWTGIGYKFTAGPAMGLSVFVAEYIAIPNTMKVGTVVDSTTVIARFSGPGSTASFSGDGIESGWASQGCTPAALGYYSGGGHMTAHGVNFDEFIQFLGGGGGKPEHPPAEGDIGPGWPKWGKK